ncbi:MAG: hypothetical protein LUF81_04365 [Clostridiales bacterium]|nr:hypothetical protein [Clostridiales bacterium]
MKRQTRTRLLAALCALCFLLAACSSSEEEEVYTGANGYWERALLGEEYAVYQYVCDEMHIDDGTDMTSSSDYDFYYIFPVYPSDFNYSSGDWAELRLNCVYDYIGEDYTQEEYFELLEESYSEECENFERMEDEEYGGETFFVYEYDGTATSGDAYHAYGHVTYDHGFLVSYTAFEFVDWDNHITYSDVEGILEAAYAVDFRELDTDE